MNIIIVSSVIFGTSTLLAKKAFSLLEEDGPPPIDWLLSSVCAAIFTTFCWVLYDSGIALKLIQNWQIVLWCIAGFGSPFAVFYICKTIIHITTGIVNLIDWPDPYSPKQISKPTTPIIPTVEIEPKKVSVYELFNE